MPIFLYKNPQTGEVKEIIQSANEEHSYSEGGQSFERIFTTPYTSIGTKINPFDSKDFVEKTKNKKGNLGNLFDAAKEASIKREEILGTTDPVKQQYYNQYSKKRKGQLHPQEKTDKLKKSLSKLGIDIER